MTSYDPDTPAPQSRYEELAERLREMRWPEPTPDARRRCWEAVQQELAGACPAGAQEAAAEADPAEVSSTGPALVWTAPADDAFEARPRRHEFATRGDVYSGALGERVAVARRPLRVAAAAR